MTEGRLSRAVVERKLRERIAALDARMAELQQLRGLLTGRLASLGCGDGAPACPVAAAPRKRAGPRSLSAPRPS